MFYRAIFAFVIAMGASAFDGPAFSAEPQAADAADGEANGRSPLTGSGFDGLRLAQSGEVEVFIDEYGRRVLVDSYTGEVLSVERRDDSRDRRYSRSGGGERAFGRRSGRYDMNDPRDIERFRRDQGLYAPPVDGGGYAEDDYGYAREEVFPEAPRGSYDDFRGGRYEEQPPILAYPSDTEKGSIIGGPIERRSLPDSALPNAAPPDAALPERRQSAVQPQEIIVDPAPPRAALPSGVAANHDVAALQVLLDRAGASPGVIDGRFGSNVDKALLVYHDITGRNLKSTDAPAIAAALAQTGGDAFTNYEITAIDAAGPYVASIPEDYGEKSKLDRLAYTSVVEMLAERFHMDEKYLRALNPEANFNRPGTIIKVANVGASAKGEVARLVADKGRKQVRGYGADGRLMVAYPATIGSQDTPSPTGSHAISRIAVDPEYTYNPKINFKQGNNNSVLRIPPGPNGPVGAIWIALDKPTYGIHGTPDPVRIGKTASHGCVRLTNWDAQELAKLVKPGVAVEFVE